VRQFNYWEFKRFENNDSVALYQPKDSYFPRVEELEPYLVEVYKQEKGRS
jgi:hypothetical protein